MKIVNNNRSGVAIVELLTVVFVVLKLCKVIDWSWVWVLSPTWIWIALLAVVLVLGIAFGGRD